MLKHYFHNWKLGIHLLFRTYRFGVNNQWWSTYDSMFGLPLHKRFHLIRRYKEMRFRSEIGFVSKKTFKEMFPIYTHNKDKRHNSMSGIV